MWLILIRTDTMPHVCMKDGLRDDAFVLTKGEISVSA